MGQSASGARRLVRQARHHLPGLRISRFQFFPPVRAGIPRFLTLTKVTVREDIIMALTKCPRCELNYISEGEGFCKVCKREMKGEKPRDDIELCTVCNEAAALPGKDVCLFCLKEMNGSAGNEDGEDTDQVEEASLSIDPVSTMDEIIPTIDENIPPREYNEIDSDLSLNVMVEDENDEDDDEDIDN
jgi:hypothetical protein